ncbi:MAG: ABC transporter ATP-binding protein [Paraclostridium sp.]
MDMLICKNLSRDYIVGSKKDKQKILALDNINLNVSRNEIFGLLGPNGAGKTTLIKIISTLLYPSDGIVSINGLDVVKHSKETKKNIGVLMSNNRSLYMKLTARENLEFFCSLYEIPYKLQKKRIDYVLKTVDLFDRQNDYVENFSHGMMQRLNIARAIIHDPKFLILDEPTNGLDPISTNELRNTILNLNNEGKTILISTHNMEEAEILSNRLAIINQGKIIASGNSLDLKNSVGNKVCEIEILNNDLKSKLNLLKEEFNDNIISFSKNDFKSTTIKFILKDEYNFENINNMFNKFNIKSKSTSLREVKLEDVFINCVNKSNKNKGECIYDNVF